MGIWFGGVCKRQYVGTESAHVALRLRLLNLQLGVRGSFLGDIQTFWADWSSWNEVVNMYIDGQEARPVQLSKLGWQKYGLGVP